MSKIRRANLTTPTPKNYVRAALNKVGLACGALWTGRPYVSTPYWSHAVIDYAMVCLPAAAWCGVLTDGCCRTSLGGRCSSFGTRIVSIAASASVT